MNRYDILLGKEYSEPKGQKEEKTLFGDFLEHIGGSGVTTNGDIQQGRIDCQITVEGRVFSASFLSLTQAQAQDDKKSMYNLSIEMPIPIVDINIFFKKVVNLKYTINTQTVDFDFLVQDISTETNGNFMSHITMSGIDGCGKLSVPNHGEEHQ